MLIENLEAGSPVGVSYPGHALVIDGYDRTNDKFHINFGWGNSSSTRWYTRSEMIEQKYNQFIYDLTLTPDKILTVNDSDLYGTGTFIRGFERASAAKGENTINFDSNIKLDELELRDYVSLTERTIVNGLNMSVRFTDNLRSSWGIGLRCEDEAVTTFNDFTGEVIANTVQSTNTALYLLGNSLTTAKMYGGLLYGGSYTAGVDCSYGSDSISRAVRSVRLGQNEITSSIINSKSYSVYAAGAEKLTLRMDESSVAIGNIYAYNCPENTIGIYNNSKVYGNVTTGSGNDSIYVYNGSLLQGNLSLGSGTNTLIVDSSSRVDGIIYSNTDFTFKLKSGYKSDALFTIQSNAYNLYSYAKSITVDFSAAAAAFL